VTTRRQLGVFKRRRAAPAPAWALVLAPSLATTAVAGATAVLMLVLGRVGWGVGLSAGALAGVVLTATIAAACFCAIAFAIAGVVRSAEAVQPVVQAILLPLYFISGVWFPADGLPHGLKVVADVFPIVHLTAPLHAAFAHDTLAAAVSPRDLAVLAAWGVGAAWVAVRRFSWLPAKDTV
jgi:ABC-2 type transport system permease protein